MARLNGVALGAVAAGSVFVYAGIKGYSIPDTIKNLISGKSPVGQSQSAPITAPPVTAPGAGGSGNYSGPIPYLGTTLPPQSEMDKYFGSMNSAGNETTVDFAGHSVMVNRAIASNLTQAGQAVKAAGLAGEIRDVGGFRTSKGGSGAFIPYSMHQYGAAIDINEDGGPNGDWHTMTLNPRLVAIMASFRWFCGENWTGVSRDGGHFQFMGGG
jgi:D-alanyl-D-alanine carboxypeptidase